MQYQRGSFETYCMTPRIEWADSSSDCDKTVRLLTGGDESGALVVAESAQKPGFRIEYRFSVSAVEISLTAGQNGTYRLPVIADHSAHITVSPRAVCFDGRLTVTADREICPVCSENKRQYNQVGGFEYFPLEIPAKAGETTTVTLKYE